MLKAIGVITIIAGIGWFLYLLFFTAKFSKKEENNSNSAKTNDDGKQ